MKAGLIKIDKALFNFIILKNSYATQTNHLGINLLFLRKLVSVAICRFIIFTYLLPIVAGVALVVLGNRAMQLFRGKNTGKFLLCP
jgi:hypothetical protein